ncbi:hypothetical protein [Sanguibacter suaedae]|uniref:Uncharacterized protein n=1 Tax=Sanguibacter suaedae TaxID=2795737 RepID=A0A934IDB1_9MICO|nr:hypothetical protein [Sanguibacter suaedae]MBI9115650.1 hypothetical protein [Sanguibacter suaedae]
MVTTVVLSVLLALVGLAAGTFSVHAARTRRFALRAVAALTLVGPVLVVSAMDASVWVIAAWIVGVMVGFVACDAILDRVGVRDPA